RAMTFAAPPEIGAVERRYELVDDVAALDHWIAAAFDQGTVAIAVQTMSLGAAGSQIIRIALGIEPGRACYLPLGHRAAEGSLELSASAQIPRETALTRLKPLFEHEGVLKIGHDVKADIAALRRVGIALAPSDCTMLLSFVLEAGAHGHELDELATRYLGQE